MPLPALVLALSAAFLHALWNLLIKRAEQKHLLAWWILLIGAIELLPFAWSAAAFPTIVWIYAFISACFEVAYFVALAAAYNAGDFSLVYPIARGAAPLLLAVWLLLLLGQHPPLVGVAGLLLLVIGLAVVGYPDIPTYRRSTNDIARALLVAFCISCYSFIDSQAVRSVHPLPYMAVMFGLTALLLTPITLVRHGLPAMLLLGRRYWRQILAVGTLTVTAYLMVLVAYTLAPPSYVSSTREVSIVIGALFGWLWLGERLGARRVLGALILVVGIGILTVAG